RFQRLLTHSIIRRREFENAKCYAVLNSLRSDATDDSSVSLRAGIRDCTTERAGNRSGRRRCSWSARCRDAQVDCCPNRNKNEQRRGLHAVESGAWRVRSESAEEWVQNCASALVDAAGGTECGARFRAGDRTDYGEHRRADWFREACKYYVCSGGRRHLPARDRVTAPEWTKLPGARIADSRKPACSELRSNQVEQRHYLFGGTARTWRQRDDRRCGQQ